MLWQHCLQQLEHEFPHQDINTWLRSLHAIEQEETLFLLAPNPIVLQQIHDEYLPRIEFHARTLSGKNNFNVVLQIGSNNKPAPKKEIVEPIITKPSIREFEELPPKQVVPQFSEAERISVESRDSFINALSEKMTFENYVEGKSNQLACAASMQVAENPGISYNPLFIYGGVGLGKTHLMHAIGNQILQTKENARVIYVYAERFVNDMVMAFRNSRIDAFKKHYRSADALLIDDIQFFANKERSMEEFFHTFNALIEDQKQIILASDRVPRELQGIDDRLRSRFNWGLSVSIDAPDLETRVAILRKKADDMQIILPNDAAFFIAQRFQSNIRELEGALQRVVASMRLSHVNEITMDFVQNALRDQLTSLDKMVSVSNIKKMVANHYNIRIADLDSQRRTRSVARPRQVAMTLAKELTSRSLPEIGNEFGGRDHTTVLHATRQIAKLRKTDSSIEEDYQILLKLLIS